MASNWRKPPRETSRPRSVSNARFSAIDSAPTLPSDLHVVVADRSQRTLMHGVELEKPAARILAPAQRLQCEILRNRQRADDPFVMAMLRIRPMPAWIAARGVAWSGA